MTDTAPPERNTGRILKWVLYTQIVFALVLFGSDLARILPQLAFPSTAPELRQPIGPGDQTRQYDPASLPQRENTPNQRPIPSTTDMPSRLLFEETTWEGEPALTLTGSIAAGDAARFDEFAETLTEPPAQIWLDSPGGSVSDALAIGYALRELGADTRMGDGDICLSACPYIFASGVERDATEDALIGVHQHYFGENTALPAFLAVEDIQRGQSDVMRYLDFMGIDPLVMQHALATPPDEIYILTRDELRDYNMLNLSEE